MSRPEFTSFAIERRLPGVPARAFRYFSDPVLKAKWTDCHPDWQVEHAAFDFRVGGGEESVTRDAAGTRYEMRSHYLDIVEGERILYAYWMSVDGAKVSASLVTVEFLADGDATRLVFTEQAAFLGADARQREDGTEWVLEKLAALLEREDAVVN